MKEAEARTLDFLEIANIQLVSVSQRELTTGLQAFDRYGRDRYPDSDRNSALNLADCFHYAVTTFHHVAPILTKDGGFARSDVKTENCRSTIILYSA